MWTEITRRKHEREGQRYASDVTDAEWALSAAFTPWSWKTCFDVSIPIRIMWSMDGLLP